MKLRLNLLLPAFLIATAGLEVVAAPDVLPGSRADQACQIDERSEGPTRIEAEQRILAEGYTEISRLAKGCDDAWHALALAEGDPVNVLVTPEGAVLTE
ncbi:hypothetical protein [Dongia deserti]|uniref:hypothetical protein n=1 Tax=Dongia deserti TaxID=2268030 RepID=UPI000E64D162|nr:hypothetical protein [Dongia deserti]